MTESENKIIKPKKAKKRHNVTGNIGRGIREFFGGEMLTSGTFKFFPFLMFIAFLAAIYISNNYYTETKIREINKIRRELKEMRYEYITSKSELTNLSKQSQLAKRLSGKGVKESTDPIKTIKIKEQQK